MLLERRRLATLAWIVTLVLVPSIAIAADGDTENGESPPHEMSKDSDDTTDGSARSAYEKAVEAYDDEQYERALDLLEQAYVDERNALYLYQRILVLEAMEEPELALQLLEDNRDELSRHPEIDELVVVEERLQSAVDTDGKTGDDPNQVVSTKSETGAGPNILGWTLVGGGIIAAGTGITLVVLGENELDRLACMPANGETPSGCDGVDAYEDLSRDEFDDKKGTAQTTRNIGYGVGVVGIGLAGWGIYELITGEDGDESALYLSPTGGRGVVATWKIQF